MNFEKKTIFDLSNGSLNEYEVGSLAPVELNNEHIHNYEDGYSISIIEDKISAILVCFRSGYREFHSFNGIVNFDKEQKYIVTSGTTLEEIISILGEPDVQWNDGVEIGLEYCINGKDIEIIWNVEGGSTLDYISVEL